MSRLAPTSPSWGWGLTGFWRTLAWSFRSALTRACARRDHVTFYCLTWPETRFPAVMASAGFMCCFQELLSSLSWFWVVTWWLMLNCDAELNLIFTEGISRSRERPRLIFLVTESLGNGHLWNNCTFGNLSSSTRCFSWWWFDSQCLKEDYGDQFFGWNGCMNICCLFETCFLLTTQILRRGLKNIWSSVTLCSELIC